MQLALSWDFARQGSVTHLLNILPGPVACVVDEHIQAAMLPDGVCHAFLDGGLIRDIQLLHMEVARCTRGSDIFTYSDGSYCIDTCWLFPDACQSGDQAVDFTVATICCQSSEGACCDIIFVCGTEIEDSVEHSIFMADADPEPCQSATSPRASCNEY